MKACKKNSQEVGKIECKRAREKLCKKVCTKVARNETREYARKVAWNEAREYGRMLAGTMNKVWKKKVGNEVDLNRQKRIQDTEQRTMQVNMLPK